MLSEGHDRWCRTASGGVGRLGRRRRWLAGNVAPEPACRTTACSRPPSSTSSTNSAEVAFATRSCPTPQKIVPCSRPETLDAHPCLTSSCRTCLSSACRLLPSVPCLGGIPADHDPCRFHLPREETAHRRCSCLRPLQRPR